MNRVNDSLEADMRRVELEMKRLEPESMRRQARADSSQARERLREQVKKDLGMEGASDADVDLYFENKYGLKPLPPAENEIGKQL